MTPPDTNNAACAEVDGWWKRISALPKVRKFLRFLKRHRETLFQLIMTVILANSPILIVYIDKITSIDPTSIHPGYWEILLGLFRGGDVYVYSAALVAPFWWTLLTYVRNRRKMWLVSIPFVLSVFCTIVGGLIYASQLAGRLKNVPVVSSLALAIFISSLVVLYWSIYCDRTLRGYGIEEPFEREQDDINDLLTDMDKAKPYDD